ncbi:MAG: hypothetical protein KME20_19505 [Kaiparowitsia implicata GSE-PSE-MK54-09C]|jgi:chromosome segregation ATPase|nr:hypothetical protein [Kaiparowitsia implicata GSE-PSE-MK54-09C]
MTERKAYQGEMEAKLQEWGAKLDAMKAKANESGTDAKAELDQKIKTLTAKREAVQQQLANLKSSSDDAWDSVKAGVQGAWNELSSAFEDAASKF